MKKKYIKIITAVLFTVLVISGVVVYLFNKPHTEVVDIKAAFFITSDVLVNDFEMNESQSNKKYLDQILEVSGKISSIEIHGDKAVVTLLSNNTMGSVTCNFINTDLLKIKELKKGMLISVKGICTGYLMDVVLVKCVIVNKKN